MRLAEILPAGTADYKSVLALLKSGADDGPQPSWLCPEIVSFSKSYVYFNSAQTQGSWVRAQQTFVHFQSWLSAI